MFSRFFIERPIFATVISIIIVIAGVVTLNTLPVAQYPELTPPVVQVSTVFPGANAQVLTQTVAAPIEQEVNGVEGMLYMSSTSDNNGAYSLNITFEVGTDLDMASVMVQNRVSAALPKLPEEVKRIGVTTKKRSNNIVLMVAVTSENPVFDDLYLSNFVTLRIKDEISRIQGVGDVGTFGLGDYSIRMWLDPEKLTARKLTIGDLANAIREQNVQVAAGQIGQPPVPQGQDFQYVINIQGRLEDIRQFGDIIVKTGEGGRVTRVRDVAAVELGSKSYGLMGQLDGKPTAVMAIYQLPGANALELADDIRRKMAELRRTFPEGIEYAIPFDTTKFVSASINEVVETLFIAIFLVFVTIFVFLQDWRATLVPVVTIPVSLIGTFAAMALLGFSVNMITLFGLVLAIGIVVDDAIVVVENTQRNIDTHRMTAREATLKAMKEVIGPVVATTLVLLAVFVPTAFLGGITGQIYRQFALTIAASTVFSSVNALTLSPALCALLLRPTPRRRNIFFRAFEWTFSRSQKGYDRFVGGTIRRGAVMMLVFLGLSGAAFWGFTALPNGFVPSEDQGWVMVSAQLPDAASFERTLKVVDKVNTRLLAIPGVQNVLAIPGYSMLDSAQASNAAAFWVVLDPWEARSRPELGLRGLLGRIYRAMNEIQEARILAFAPPAIQGLGVAGGFQMQLQDRGDMGLAALEQMAFELATDANAQSGLARVYTTFRANVPQLFADIDRTKAKTLGVSLSEIFNSLQAYLGSVYVNDFNKFGRTFPVNIQADPRFRVNRRDLRRIKVRNADGDMIPVSTLLKVKDTLGPQTISRYNLYPTAAIMGSAGPGYSSGDALTLMERIAAAKLPPAMGFEWTGISYQQRATAGQAIVIFALAVIFVYLVLCAQYESWSIPMGVIFSVPLALLGTIAAIAIRAMDINVYTQIGIVLLIGLASKNAILIVEFAKEARESGKGILEAAAEAARLRFRPILMTSFAFVFGTFPLVVASGAGAGSRKALGTAVFGGMLTATVLTVLFVPVFYVVIQRLGERVRMFARGREATASKVRS